MRRLKCAEIWGGIKNTDLDVCSSGVTVSLYSSACDGGRGGDVYYFSVCGADRVTRLVTVMLRRACGATVTTAAVATPSSSPDASPSCRSVSASVSAVR